MACDEFYNPLDWNVDAIVDLDELLILAHAWLSDPCTDNWNPDCDLQPESGDGDVDYGDFAVFSADWLWQPCWTSSETGMWMMMGGGMDGMMGMQSMLIGDTTKVDAASQQQISEVQPTSEPSVAEQIEMVKECLDFWYREDVREGIEDKDVWLGIVTSLEDMLKELEDSH